MKSHIINSQGSFRKEISLRNFWVEFQTGTTVILIWSVRNIFYAELCLVVGYFKLVDGTAGTLKVSLSWSWTHDPVSCSNSIMPPLYGHVHREFKLNRQYSEVLPLHRQALLLTTPMDICPKLTFKPQVLINDYCYVLWENRTSTEEHVSDIWSRQGEHPATNPDIPVIVQGFVYSFFRKKCLEINLWSMYTL